WDDAERAVTMNPNSVTAQYTAGVVAVGREDLSTAQSAFEQSLALHHHAPAARLRLAEVRLALGDRTRALSDARTAAAERPDDPRAAILLSRALRAGGDAAEARRQLQQDIGRLPAQGSLYTELGWLELDVRNAAAAPAAFAPALRVAPGAAKAREGAVAADLATGDVAGARAKVRTWLAGRPDDEDTLLLAARIDLAQNDLA